MWQYKWLFSAIFGQGLPHLPYLPHYTLCFRKQGYISQKVWQVWQVWQAWPKMAENSRFWPRLPRMAPSKTLGVGWTAVGVPNSIDGLERGLELHERA